MPDERPGRRQQRRAIANLCLILLLMLAVLGGATAFLWISLPSHNQERQASLALFGVQEITVTGESRYDPGEIIAASGIRKGQSIFSLNKVAAHDAVLAGFPYLEAVEVFSNTLNTVEIRVTETEVLGAAYHDGSWLVIGQNGKGLEQLSVSSNTPPRYLYLKGAKIEPDVDSGRLQMTERCLKAVTTLKEAFTRYRFEGVSVIDLTDLSDIRLTLNNRIVIKMGNATQLTYQVAVLANSLKYVYESYGKKAEGLLDISSYSDDENKDMVVFTPRDTLENTGGDTGSDDGPDETEEEPADAQEPETDPTAGTDG